MGQRGRSDLDPRSRTVSQLRTEINLVAKGGSRKTYLGGAGPSSFERQQRLSEITIEQITPIVEKLGLNYPEKNWGEGDWARFGGPVPPGPNVEPPLLVAYSDQHLTGHA